VLSDFDSEGEDIPHRFARSLRDDFGVQNVVAMKVALTRIVFEDPDLLQMEKPPVDRLLVVASAFRRGRLFQSGGHVPQFDAAGIATRGE
jgi:hypothetical protein